MKKILILLFVFCLCVCVSGCKEVLPDASSSPEPSPSATPEPSPTPEPTPTPMPYTNGLNGEPSETDINKTRPFAVMLNNINIAMPQCGLSKADILYEMLDEGGITRMMAVFSDISEAGALGSMRSARPYNIEVSESYDAIYVHAGGSDQAYSDIANRDVDNIDGVNGPYGAWAFPRDKDRMAGGMEHSMFTSTELLQKIMDEEQPFEAEHDGGSYDYGLSFTEDAKPVSGVDAKEFEVKFSTGKSTYFSYDEETNSYTVRQHGSDYIDGNTDEILHFDNVIVLYAAHITLDSEGRLAINLKEGGEGWFANGGSGEDIKWGRDGTGGVFTYETAKGDALELGIGKTFICVVPIGNTVILPIESPEPTETA